MGRPIVKQLTERELIDFAIDQATPDVRRRVAHQLTDENSYASRWLGFMRIQSNAGPFDIDFRRVLDVNDRLEEMRQRLYGPNVATARLVNWLISNFMFWSGWAALLVMALPESPLLTAQVILVVCGASLLATSTRAIRSRQLPTGTLWEAIIGGMLFLAIAAIATECLQFLPIVTESQSRHLALLASFAASWLGMYRGFVLSEQFIAEEHTMKRVLTQWLQTTIGLAFIAGAGVVPILLMVGNITAEQWSIFGQAGIAAFMIFATLGSLRPRFTESVLYGGLVVAFGMAVGFVPYAIDQFLRIVQSQYGTWLMVATVTASYGIWWKTCLDVLGDYDHWAVRPDIFIRQLEGLLCGQLASSVTLGLWLPLITILPELFTSAIAATIVGIAWLAIFMGGYSMGKNRLWLTVSPKRVESYWETVVESLATGLAKKGYCYRAIHPRSSGVINPIKELFILARTMLPET